LSCSHYFEEIFCNSCNIFQALRYIIIPKTGREISTEANKYTPSVLKSASSISQTQTKASKLAKIINEIFRSVLVIKKRLEIF
jgi:hypothetical protein